ncbi:diguanylate cyclase [Cyanobium gracile]|uniref:Diguanylate cyclase n=1 Tax=Cyanobium gracile UHCC 0281 TaxID=3110309 RepID=A0ABU5SWN6_9CYAN|nr:diguanylate cyclase [Cyanobium gracile]MEA5442871.1 diguanylate cyclase [Cyanobium gracile UHCC 0281]
MDRSLHRPCEHSSSHPRFDAPASQEEPIEIAPGVWWVGVRLLKDHFQCHTYFIANGSDGVLIDPGSPLTIDGTLAKLRRITDLNAIRWIVCHHSDPDICASLPRLSEVLQRPDVQVVTEWRAKALIRHYGHRFTYHLVEEHGWVLPLEGDRRLEFQLTPYLHFPGAMVSYDTSSHTLFSSDLFGGFVPDSGILESDDAAYILDNARPFHQHYMPSRELLSAGLARIRSRWPEIERIAPQHGHIVAGSIVDDVFRGLANIECGVFCLADADVDLKRLLVIAEARQRLTDALMHQSSPLGMVRAMATILESTGQASDCELAVDLPGDGWTTWTTWATSDGRPVRRLPNPDWHHICLLGDPAMVLALRGDGSSEPFDPDMQRMLREFAESMRPWVDHLLEDQRKDKEVAVLNTAALCDPLTGLANRRALEAEKLSGIYSLIELDLDHFKNVNDTFGHESGDRVLKQLAQVLNASVREQDHTYRLGGEEFLVLLPEADRETALLVAERIRLSVRQLNLEGDAPGGRITVSLGVSTKNATQPCNFSQLMEQADRALYAAKDSGRDRVCIADDVSVNCG